MSLRTYWTRCRTWWRGKRRLHKALVWFVMLAFIVVPLTWFAPTLAGGCVNLFVLWFALFVIGTVPKDTF